MKPYWGCLSFLLVGFLLIGCLIWLASYKLVVYVSPLPDEKIAGASGTLAPTSLPSPSSTLTPTPWIIYRYITPIPTLVQ